MGLIREVRPYKTRNNAPQKVRKMPHEKAETGAAIIPGHYQTLFVRKSHLEKRPILTRVVAVYLADARVVTVSRLGG